MTTTLLSAEVATTPSRSGRVLSFVGQVAAWSVILVVAAVLAVAVLIPRLGGATPYTILTGSMTPGMPPGTLVVVKPVPMDQIGVGTVITYQLHSGEPTVVTHRVVAVGVNALDERVFTTQGDANEAADPAPVRPVQVRGERWYAVPKLGYLNTWLNGDQRQLAVYVVAGGLGMYALWMFGSSFVDRRRRDRERGERA